MLIASNTNSELEQLFNVPSNSRHFFIMTTANVNVSLIGIVMCSSNGAVALLEISKGSGVSYTMAANRLTITRNSNYVSYHAVALSGNEMTVV